jgi:surface polysaccharide O-acyltransferase-like enzyme
MGLYFLYAGYFTPRSYDRKGPALFWKDRLLRLAIPMVAYTLVLSKLPNYISWVANDGMRLSFGEYFVRYFWQDADAGPTWFLFTLLIFSVGYTVWRLLTPISGSGARLSRLPIPGTRTLLLVGLLMAMMTFVVSQILPIGEGIRLFGAIPQLIQFFPTYILLFIGGVLAYRNDWLTRLPGKSLRFWSWLSAGLLVALPALLMFGGAPDGYMDEFLGGLNWRCATFCLWLGLACVSFSMTLSLWLRERVKPGDRLSAYVGPNNFAVYLIHPLILVPIAWVLTFSGIPGMLKFGLLSASTVLLCFLLADVLRRVPGLKQVL